MYIDSQGRKWFKGNLHMHTTVSDGRYAPNDALNIYKDNGYDFVCCTDHWICNEESDHRGMLVLSGCEYDIGASSKEGIFHILGVGLKKDPMLQRGVSADEVADAIHKAGGLVCLAHPAWSLNSPEDIMNFKGFDFSEIFNSVSDRPFNARPYSGLLFDIAATKGKLISFAATDDTHRYEEGLDLCRSFVYVQADSCTRADILNAIKDGRYYASQGPTMEIEKKGDKIVIDTSSVKEITYFTDNLWIPHRCDRGNNVVHGEYIRVAKDHFLRMEIKDGDGNYAWSQYISFE